MPAKTPASALAARHYEFGGPLGVFGISFGLPILLYVFWFFCNDISGCPVPSALSPSTLDIERLKVEMGWPENGLLGFFDLGVLSVTVAYYIVNLFLYAILPAEIALAFTSNMAILAGCLSGTIAEGADFIVWRYIDDKYLQIMTSHLIIAYALATYSYIGSFSVKPGNKEMRELAIGGQTGNILYDWFIGRELNPRVTLPFFGEIDIKEWCELRPGLLMWALCNFTWVAKQYRNYGYVSDSMVFLASIQTLYVIDAWYYEPAILTMIDITLDGFGNMLSFGDLVWVPFLYSTQTRYLATYPVTLGPYGLAATFIVLLTGFMIFRSSNSEKNEFRRDPKSPKVAHLKYITTKTGSKLLITGWWGMARHINYLGDWIQSWPYSLPTGVAGYTIMAAGSGVEGALIMLDGREVVQGAARGWGILFTYFYVFYFATLLLHREGRDDDKCYKKYGDDWLKYKKQVPYKIIPYIY
ncbi:Delta(14)-sterol reductase [Ceratocystis fimbriata CBS 114723]|uniref:Delta(14)-sterol reductase n=1 Tax=Ceratocystis fimbriata CBS 114723 TaxID=1035309 RepID=A0A2C5X7E4_9PEZI|nr:Delta(14)-sterol reductase [Ceratocystis fimbriata CBS 114723]